MQRDKGLRRTALSPACKRSKPRHSQAHRVVLGLSSGLRCAPAALSHSTGLRARGGRGWGGAGAVQGSVCGGRGAMG